ncbi:tetratricopeptide repeat protein, tpr [Anopheles sinensis]|uniref:Tetratricopeptide repeat protein, tpr n=1 Tax=Anopheles sinensis TaxID=74873 RepID=A0A084W0W7_ANOSI|nr:tetratricopeptide repeat protein, tpr [Anopheles sinensis]
MDNFFAAISLFRRRKYDECIEVCNVLLQQNALHQGPWELKMRSMTQRVYIDDIEADDDVAGRMKGLFRRSWHAFVLRFPASPSFLYPRGSEL